ncbi:MAG: NnrU protein [Deltaproteobacteria bacterium]|nr:NnrU protein [Deltaproteobacteria bacterium]MBW2362489.1 NnrU protein [Deltaproteobacteria bacterium]
MICLLLGVVLWSGVHLVPCVGIGLRARLIARLGEPAYKGAFALTLVATIVLMVVGWRSSAPGAIYATSWWGVVAVDLLMLVALVLFAASAVPSNLKRIVRHPQLTGVALWAAAHLLANREPRSLLLFGGLGLWAIATMLLLNRRDGAWEKPAAQPPAAEFKLVLGATIAFAALFFAHVHLFGVSPLPR